MNYEQRCTGLGRIAGGLLTLALALPSAALADSASYSNVYVFGDSLSDQGNVSALTRGGVPGADYFQGRFSNGPIYTDHLADSLGVDINPLAVPIFFGWQPAFGNNLSYGGALINGHRSGLPLGVVSQIQIFLASGIAIPSDVLIVAFGGANDVQRAIGVANDNATEAEAAMMNPAAAEAAVAQAAADLAGALLGLIGAGAKTILVPNGPNWAVTPAVVRMNALVPGYSEFATQISMAFNDALASELDAVEASTDAALIRVDFFGLLDDMVANPAKYGFENVTERCYTGDDLGFSGGGDSCDNPEEHMFWDRVHPTTRAHEFIGECFHRAVFPRAAAAHSLGDRPGAWQSCAGR